MHPDFFRYSCQLALPGFDEEKQQQLQKAKVLIAGAGGLGCPSALYLAASGIGTIGIADYDSISVSNLHRQVLFTAAEVGWQKATVACTKLQLQNPGISLVPHEIKITNENVMALISPYDLVLDCTDNFETKYLLNDACVLAGKPLVYGAIYQYEGQVSVFNVVNPNGFYSPNYRDIFPDVNPLTIPNCADGGVMPTLAGIIGCMQANEALKYFTGDAEILSGKMLMFDSRTLQSRIIKTGNATKTNITTLAASPHVPLITSEQLKRELNNNAIELIDVRSPDEHNQFNIGGKNLLMNELERNIRELVTRKKIVLYCATGKRSMEAAKFINNKFPEINILSLEGGLQSWKEMHTDH